MNTLIINSLAIVLPSYLKIYRDTRLSLGRGSLIYQEERGIYFSNFTHKALESNQAFLRIYNECGLYTYIKYNE